MKPSKQTKKPLFFGSTTEMQISEKIFPNYLNSYEDGLILIKVPKTEKNTYRSTIDVHI